MMEYLHESSLKGESVVWKTLSIENFMGRAKIEFKSSKNLHAALKNGTIQSKLVRFLRDQFRWGQSEKIEIYDDYVPYSFFFREIRNGKAGISGGLILHGHQYMKMRIIPCIHKKLAVSKITLFHPPNSKYC